MMWTGFHLARLYETEMPSPDGRHDGRQEPRIILDRGEEIAHLVLLVDDVVREEEAARDEAREHQIEEPFVVAFPGVDEHEIERPVELRDLLERVARHDRDDVGEAGGPDVGGGDLRARRVELDGRQASAGFPQPQAHPDRAVARRRRRSRARASRRSWRS